MKKIFRLFSGGVAAVMSLVLLTGCLSDNPGSSSIAYVDIPSHGEDAVRAQAIRVFGDDNYLLVGDADGMLTFEREGTQRDRVLYGRYGDQLTMRVLVTIEPRRQGGSLVRADAFAMNGGSETQVMRIGRRPYMDLLNRVKANLATVVEIE